MFVTNPFLHHNSVHSSVNISISFHSFVNNRIHSHFVWILFTLISIWFFFFFSLLYISIAHTRTLFIQINLFRTIMTESFSFFGDRIDACLFLHLYVCVIQSFIDIQFFPFFGNSFLLLPLFCQHPFTNIVSNFLDRYESIFSPHNSFFFSPTLIVDFDWIFCVWFDHTEHIMKGNKKRKTKFIDSVTFSTLFLYSVFFF